MPYNRARVRAFLTAAELALFESSVGAQLEALRPADLQRRIARTRTLRDKYRDLLRRQTLKTRERTGSKTGSTGQANARTGQKATVFDEVLARFEAQAHGSAPVKSAKTARKAPQGEPARVVLRRALEKKNTAQTERINATAPARSVKAPAAEPVSAPDGVRPTPPDVRAVAVESRLNSANLKSIQGHTSTQVRQAQAKRDRRGG